MRKTVGLLVIIVVIILASLHTSPDPALAQPPGPSKREMAHQVTAASDGAVAKIDPSLRSQMHDDGEVLVEVIVFVTPDRDQPDDKDTDVTALMEAGAVTRTILGQTRIVGRVRAGDLAKLASRPDVVAVVGVHRFEPPDPVMDPDVPQKRAIAREMIRQRVQAIRAAGDASDRDMLGALSGRHAVPSAREPLSAVAVTGWWDVSNGHKSAAAWAKGYTGAGVMVAALDSGVDFAHPDLQGTWAVQPHGPYAGWPIAFDSFSMSLYARYGATYGPDVQGVTWYADTSTTCTSSPCTFQPLDAGQAHDYTLPTTSKSGVYHIGTHPDTSLEMGWYRERVAVLVVDENAPGVYDTVYVDLDDDYDFTDEKPVTKDDPISWKDNWNSAQGRPGSDGYPDLSGGLVYYISDGVNYIPMLDWTWLPFVPSPPPLPGPGDMVAFMICDARKLAGNHGQRVASAIAGQGVIDGGAPAWKPLASAVGGIDQGGGRDARIVAVGNIYRGAYFDIYDFAALGYDGLPGTGDEPQIVNISFGNAGTDNDGWDFESRYQAWLGKSYAPTLAWVASTGNGAPGYGTIAPPTAHISIGVSASTQYGATGRFDSIQSVDQINWGDVMSWSNRGPGARGNNGVSVLANGAWGAGALTLNEWGDGWTAWDTWGGTSRSAPVAAGNLALVYQAYKDRTGEFPTYDVARALLMSSATDVGYNPLAQGAGSLDADRATDVAAGLYGIWVSPNDWPVGDYRGREYEGFANIIQAGQADTQTFSLHNPSPADITVNLSDAYVVQMGDPLFYTIASKNQNREDGAFTKPDYLIEVTDQIPPDADFMEVKATILYDEFTDSPPDSRQLDSDTQWRVIVYDWTDVNGDGNLWTDLNGDGIVNSDEIDSGEYIRFNYGYNRGTTMQATVQHPARRHHDGLFVGLRHRNRTPRVPSTHVRLRLTFYKRVDWPWLVVEDGSSSLTVPAGGTATFEATLSVPADAPPGFYEGLILVEDPGDGNHDAHTSVIPVSVNVAASSTDFSIGGVAQDTPYDNGRIFGFFDWDWRAESGDWRFYFTDVPDDHGLPPGTRWLVHTWWETYPTDVDTIVMGPTSDDYSDPEGSYALPEVFGPYTLNVVGRSENTYQGSGRWAFNTSSGSVDEWVSAPLTSGLHLFALHNVLFSGKVMEESISGRVGTVSAVPDRLVVNNADVSGGQDLHIVTSMDLPDVTADAYGLSRPQVYHDLPTIADDPAFPSTSSYTYQISIQHGGLLEARTVNASGESDIDLYVLHDFDGDGTFDFNTEIVGSSTTPTGDEWVQIKFPEDGEWLVAVHGWDTKPGDTFDITIRAIQGRDLFVTGTPTGPIAGGSAFDVNVQWRRLGMGSWEGLAVLGPRDGPAALIVPVTLERLGQEAIIAALPTDAGYVKSTRPLENTFGGGRMMTGTGTGRQAYHGAVQFDLSSLPTGAEIIAAQVELTGLDERYVNPYATGQWRLQLLESSVDLGWRNHGYWHIGRAAVEESIGPVVADAELGAGVVNTFVFAPSQLAALSDRLSTTGKASFRLDARVIPTGSRHLFSWDGGRGGAPPVLRIVYLP